MRRAIVMLVTLFSLGASPAEALSVRDVIELSKGGLSDEILLALIEIDRRVFPVDAETLRTLKEAGVSERVILAMVRSGRMPAADPPLPAPQTSAPAAPEPQVIVVDHHDHPAPRVQEVAVPVPVYVPVFVHSPRTRTGRGATAPIVPFSTIGLPHPRLGLSAPPPKPTSDPPNWKQQRQP